MNVQELVKEFADCTEAQMDEIRKGDAVTGNRYAERCIAAFDKLRTIGDEGLDALASLFFDRRPVVRVNVAAFLLRRKHAEATAVLKREAKGKGLTAFEAEQALERWAEGAWELDPE
jgi:hypothetical protein